MHTWEYGENRIYNEIMLSATEQAEEEGFVVKEILRTGEWSTTPTTKGLEKKKLTIVRDGHSDADKGILSMSELVDNFNKGIIERVQVPLSDDKNDHKNITRLNTGFVRELFIKDEGKGSKLVAKIEFTEPEIKEKVLRGTYADVSCGIPWDVFVDGENIGSLIEHVCITNRPYIDNLGPFIAASSDVVKEGDETEIVAFSPENEEPVIVDPNEETEPVIEVETPDLTVIEIWNLASEALEKQLGLTDHEVIDSKEDNLIVKDTARRITWMVPFTFVDKEICLGALGEWKIHAIEEEVVEQPVEQKPAEPLSASKDKVLEAAHFTRELRLSRPVKSINGKEAINMNGLTLSREQLEGLELSDEQLAVFQNVLDQNAELSAKNREGEAETRIQELKEMGLEERPGFLKFYREIFLNDDREPAVLIFSENGQEKESLTALEILDRAINALSDNDGKVQLSAQALVSGNDERPPLTPEGERPVKERIAEAKEALYGKKEEE